MRKANVSSSFNSLQTGKHIQRGRTLKVAGTGDFVSIPFKRESISKGVTGRRGDVDPERVSIPFKRESISKVGQPERQHNESKWFQFPSNGKAYPKTLHGCSDEPDDQSFNSLQTGKHIQRNSHRGGTQI